MARSSVANDKTLDQAIDDQLRMLRKKSGAMTITPTKIARLGGGEHSVEAREMAIEFKVGDKPNFQLQAACLIPGQHRLLVINYSKPSPLSSDHIEHWRGIQRTDQPRIGRAQLRRAHLASGNSHLLQRATRQQAAGESGRSSVGRICAGST